MKEAVRNLRADEIECRVGTISEKGLSLLLYKDARVDQNLLDECYGTLGWQRKHERIGESIYCTVSVKDKSGEWISKQDVGTESYADAVKGAASDSFKRACVNFGIGRELYTAPFIWIPAEKADIRSDGKRFVTKERFSVSYIAYGENKTITELGIINKRGETVYYYCDSAGKKRSQTGTMTAMQKRKLREELERTGVTGAEVRARYQIDDIQSMPQEIYDKVIQALSKTKDKAA